MIANQNIQPEPDSLSVRWISALITSCLSLVSVRLFRSGLRLALPSRDESSLSHGTTPFLNAATTAKIPPMARIRNVRYTSSSVFTSSQSPRAVELPYRCSLKTVGVVKIRIVITRLGMLVHRNIDWYPSTLISL